ncbi:MAG: hypothetical protein WBB32_02155 [Flavobacteriales bacterium]|nr:hypothetical protein [Flavobacteriales bacterium]
MTVEQRKIELIRWITNLSDGPLLDRVDDLRKAVSEKVPDPVMRLLELSAAAAPSELVEHSSVKELLKRK